MIESEQNGARGAFTMIEMVVVIVILMLVSGITVQYLGSAGRLYSLLVAQRQIDTETMGAVARLRREARLHTRTLAANSNQWQFLNVDNQTNTFLRTGSSLTLNNYRLASGVSRFNLSYYDDTNHPTTNLSLIKRVALDFKATNLLTYSELMVNFYITRGLYK